MEAFYTFWCLLFLFYLRLGLAHRIRIARLHALHEINLQRLDDWATDKSPTALEIPILFDYEKDVPNSLFMIFDLRKWTYSQFFPEG